MSSENTYAEILLSGAFAAFTIDLLVYPLDTIKTRLQSQDYIKTYAATPAKTSSVSAAAANALQRAQPSPYALRGLYQGVGSVVIATLPASGVFFSTYESTKQVIGHVLPSLRDGGKAPPAALVNSLASGVAEMASCLVLTPAEVIKQNAQMIQAGPPAVGQTAGQTASKAVKPSVSSSLQALQMLRQAEGGAARRLWSGYTALVARNLPFTALQFPMFEATRQRLLARWEINGDAASADGKLRQLLLVGIVNGLSAGSSGAVAAVVTTPTDVVKTRMMLSPSALSAASTDLQPSSSSSASEGHQQPAGRRPTRHAAKEARPRHMNGLQLARLIYREHGVQGLFRGGALRAAWTFVGSGLYLGTYEMTKAWLRVRREAEELRL